MSDKNVGRRLGHFLRDGEKFDLASGDALKFLPEADDTGKMQIGDGTNDMDFQVFLGSTTEFVLMDVGNSRVDYGADDKGVDVRFFGETASAVMTWDQSADALVFAGGASIAPKYTVTAKTTSYTVTSADFGTIFTTRGAAGAVTFTLPAASGNSGEWVEFYNVADQNMIIDGTDEEIVCFNDLTADSIAFQTTSEKIGGGFRAVCDGTSWILTPLATETQTVTVTSA